MLKYSSESCENLCEKFVRKMYALNPYGGSRCPESLIPRGVDPDCAGFLPGTDLADSDALCLDAEECKAMCWNLDESPRIAKYSREFFFFFFSILFFLQRTRLIAVPCTFEKIVQKIVISGNCLQFPEILEKFR